MAVKALLFDFDGTLADNAAAYEAAWIAVFREVGCEVPDAILREAVRHLSDDALILRYLHGWTRDAALARRDGYYQGQQAAGVVLRPGVRPLLEAARSAGLYCGIVSASTPDNLRAVMDRTDIAPCFSLVLSRADVTAPKPDPEAYCVALDRLGLHASEALAFEDSPAGVAAAVSAGLRVIGIGPQRLATRRQWPDFAPASRFVMRLAQRARRSEGRVL